MSFPPHKENLPLSGGEKTKKAIEDWNHGKELLEQRRASPQTSKRKASTAIQRAFTQIEKCMIEPFANLLDRADIFRIVEKISPVLEAAGAIMIPIVIWWMTETGQKAKELTDKMEQAQQEQSDKAARAQEVVKTYLNQLSTVFLDGNLENDERLRTVTRASTLALLNDPNLDGNRKGQLIKYLVELRLVQAEAKQSENSKEKEKFKRPLISLASSNLNDTDLRGADLREADLREADLREADISDGVLIKANLREAKLAGADLREAVLMGANFKGANFKGADLKGARLSGARLSGARLSGANFSGADLGNEIFREELFIGADLKGAKLAGVILRGTDLSGAHIGEADLKGAELCGTKLPRNIENLDPNRDCKELGITP